MATHTATSRVVLGRPSALRRAAAGQCAASAGHNAPARQGRLQVSADARGLGSAQPRDSASASLRIGHDSKAAHTGSSSTRDVAACFSGGDGAGGSGSSGGSGGGGGGGDGNDKGDVESALAAAGRKLTDFPADFSSALTAGTVSAGAIATWMTAEKSLLSRFLLYRGGQGFRERLLGDPLFMTKLGIELGVGVCTKLTAERTKRKGDFFKEIDFVLANVLMAILADFALTWLPAPTLPLSPVLTVGTSGLKRFLQACPDNAFQMATASRKFSLLQRATAILRNGAKLFCVGTGASFIGTGFTNGIIAVRSAMDPTIKKDTADMNLVTQSLAYGLYMSVSSNIRYQVVAGLIEERGIERVLGHKYPLASAVASFAVRTGNTFVGSLLWVDFVRLLDLQKQVAAPPPPPPPAPTKGGKKDDKKKK